jgi:hypothetical protein
MVKKMDRKDVWNLFKMTGKIEYFLKYKDMCKKAVITLGDNESERNNN